MEELDLKELFSMFWNKKMEIVFITLILMVVGIIYSYFYITPVYTAKTDLVLVQSSSTVSQTGDSAITSTDITMNSKLVSTYSELIKRNAVFGQVASNLNISDEEAEKIKNNISVNSAKDTEIIEIKVTGISNSTSNIQITVSPSFPAPWSGINLFKLTGTFNLGIKCYNTFHKSSCS